MPNVKRRRRLGDLYVRGKEVSVDDGSGEPVTIWIQKLNEIERDAVLRRASAAKARYQLEYEHEESELFVATFGSVREFLDRDGLVTMVISEDLVKARQRVESQILNDEEGWGKENKIQNLIDAWTGTDETPGLAAVFAEDENDPEAIRIKGEIEAFEADVERAVESERVRLAREWDDTPEPELSRLATREVLKRRADEEFIREWGRQQIFYSVRDPDDHGTRYFGVLQEVDDLDDQIRQFLDRQCSTLSVDLSEGKDLPATTPSSNSSDSTEEALAISGPAAVTP